MIFAVDVQILYINIEMFLEATNSFLFVCLFLEYLKFKMKMIYLHQYINTIFIALNVQ